MFNKSKLKKYITDGKKGELLAFDKKEGWIVDGYVMFTTKGPVMETVLNEMFYKADSVYFRNGAEGDQQINYSGLIEKDHKAAKPLELTPYIHGDGKHVARVFLDADHNEIRCQQKYLDVLDDYREYRYTQTHSVAPVYIWDNDFLIGFILPIRINESDGFKVVRI